MLEKFALRLSQSKLGSIWQSHKVVLLLFLIFGAGVLLRIYELGAESLWLDEAVSVSYSKGSLSSILDYPLARNNPPFYWILLHFWIGLFGTSEAALRPRADISSSVSLIMSASSGAAGMLTPRLTAMTQPLFVFAIPPPVRSITTGEETFYTGSLSLLSVRIR